MSIRRKTLLIFGGILIGLVAVIMGLSQLVILQSFIRLENDQMLAHARRVANTLTNELAAMRVTNSDWAGWDDTYAYTQGEYPEYVENNLADEYIVNLGLNLFVITNASAQVLFSRSIDLNEGTAVDLPAELPALLTTDSVLINHPDTTSSSTGIIFLDGVPMLVSASPIVTSTRQGPIMGSLIMGRWLDDAKIAELADAVQLSVSAWRYQPETAPAGLNRPGAAVAQPLNNNLITAYILLPDISGAPALVLAVEDTRAIYTQGRSAISYFLLALIGAGGVLSLVTLILLDRVVLSRVAALHDWAERIRHDTLSTERSPFQGKDEIASLAAAMNAMLDSLAETQGKLVAARDDALGALRFKNQILANVSHDARTPLSVISLRTEMMLQGIYGPLTNRQQEIMESIGLNARQMLFFVNNLLDEAALSNGRLRLKTTDFAPSELLQNVLLSLQPLAKKNSLELITDLDPNLPASLQGDVERLNQIIYNLVGNAIKFTEEGRIWVRFRRPDSAHWQIEVEDTGPGIPENMQSRIFESFYQVDGSSTRRVTTGVGLGLSIVRQLVDLMQGAVDLQSQVGQGTLFRVTLPLHTVEQGLRIDEPA
jgi:signal transduction histidine kinase